MDMGLKGRTAPSRWKRPIGAGRVQRAIRRTGKASSGASWSTIFRTPAGVSLRAKRWQSWCVSCAALAEILVTIEAGLRQCLVAHAECLRA